MTFLNYEKHEMITLKAVRSVVEEVVNMYFAYFWAAFNNGECFERVFEGFKDEIREELEKGHSLKNNHTLILYKKGKNEYENEILIQGSNDGNYRIIAKWGCSGKGYLEKLTVFLDRKELSDDVAFDWCVGDAIFKCVIACLIKEAERFGSVETIYM